MNILIKKSNQQTTKSIIGEIQLLLDWMNIYKIMISHKFYSMITTWYWKLFKSLWLTINSFIVCNISLNYCKVVHSKHLNEMYLFLCVVFVPFLLCCFLLFLCHLCLFFFVLTFMYFKFIFIINTKYFTWLLTCI